MKVFHGLIITSSRSSPSTLIIHHPGTMGIDSSSGKIVFIEGKEVSLGELQRKYGFKEEEVERLGKRQFLIPGFIDTHTHAAQYTFTGSGMDKPLLEWLDTTTFPRESSFKESSHARQIYEKSVSRHLLNGTTTCVYYSSIHLEAAKILAHVAEEKGQRAFVGKVCMDQNSPDFYRESTEESLRDTEEFVSWAEKQKFALVTPVITPRFAITCTPKLMKGLGEIAKKHKVPIQSHLAENLLEVDSVSKIFPECKSYTEVYDQYNCLQEGTIMAHCIYLSVAELNLIKTRGAGVSHCPNSNIALRSGLIKLRDLMERDIKVGLGTDVAGGNSFSMLNAIRFAITVSNINNTLARETQNSQISTIEAFHLATVGGARVVGLEDKIGSLEVGKIFDALLIDPEVEGSPFDIFENDTVQDIFNKFIFLGDDRNVASVFVQGKLVLQKGATESQQKRRKTE